MSRIMGKRVRIGKYAIPALLLVALIVGTVAAVAYVVLQWTMTATVFAHPQVCFVKWEDVTEANTFAYSVNIFPNIKTVDENITYGVSNWNTTHPKMVYFRLASHNTNTKDINKLNYTIWDGTTTVYSYESDALDTSWSSEVSLVANTKYTIWIEITAGEYAGVGHTPQLTFEMKVKEP